MDAWRQKDAQLAERTADATMTNAVSRIRQATIDNGNMLPSAMDMAATDLAEKKRLSAEQYNEWQNTRFMRAMSGWRNRGNLMKFQEQVADMQYRNAMRQEHVGRSIRSMAETLVDVEGNIDTKALESLRPQVAAMAQSGGLDIISGMTLLNTATKRASNEARFRTFRQKQIDDTLKTERELRTDLIRQQIENAKKPKEIPIPKTTGLSPDIPKGALTYEQAVELWKNNPDGARAVLDGMWSVKNPAQIPVAVATQNALRKAAIELGIAGFGQPRESDGSGKTFDVDGTTYETTTPQSGMEPFVMPHSPFNQLFDVPKDFKRAGEMTAPTPVAPKTYRWNDLP